MSFDKFLETVQKYTLYILIILFPVFVLTQFPSPYIIAKEILLVGGICLLTALWVIRMFLKGSLSFSVGRFDLGVLLIALAYLVSSILVTPNKAEAFLFPGVTTFIVSGAFLYFLVNQFDKKTKEGAAFSLLGGAILLSLSILLSTLGAFSKIPQFPAFIKDSAFNPMGGNIPGGVYLATIFLLSVGFIVKEKESIKKVFFGVAAAFILFSLIILIGQTLPGKPQAPKLMNTQTSWEVTVETLKKNPVLGAGPANYLTAFNLYRPVTYNQSDLWQMRFSNASNYYFTLLTETGFAGLLAIVILLITVYKLFSKEPGSNFEKYSLVGLLVIFALLPATPQMTFLLFVLLALFSHSETKTVRLNVSSSDTGSFVSSRVPAIIVGLPFIAGIVLVILFGSKMVSAEATFKKSLDALAKNDAKGTYDNMAKAISQNNRVDRYHAGLAQVDMALASSLAGKKDITDAERSTITQLVQQAISEGKATVTLNPGRSGNWEILAQIYRSIMPFATGADQFAVQTYTQAVSLDPTNPSLRIALGGVYYALGRYDDAISTFKLAVLAKNDLANAHYNLAIAYREKKDFDNAIAEMNNVLALVNKDSEDYKLAKSILADLEKNKATKEATSTDNLQSPKAVEQSNIKPPIELPSEATPPATNQ